MGERFEDALGETENAYGARPRSALAGLSRDTTRSGARLSDGGLCGVVRLEGDLSDPVVQERVEAVLGGGFPEPGRAASMGEFRLLRLTSHELLALTPYESAPDCASRIITALADLPAASVLCASVSDAYALLRLVGPGAREVVSKGAAIDLHPRVFGAENVARAHIGPVETILLTRLAAEQSDAALSSLDLLAPRSQARSLFRWLQDAATTVDKAVAVPDL